MMQRVLKLAGRISRRAERHPLLWCFLLPCLLFGFGFGGSVLYCGIGLVVFMLLTAYDTQKLSQMFSYYAYDGDLAEKASIYGALTLYLDFINIFLYVVRLLGMNSRRRN